MKCVNEWLTLKKKKRSQFIALEQKEWIANRRNQIQIAKLNNSIRKMMAQQHWWQGGFSIRNRFFSFRFIFCSQATFMLTFFNFTSFFCYYRSEYLLLLHECAEKKLRRRSCETYITSSVTMRPCAWYFGFKHPSKIHTPLTRTKINAKWKKNGRERDYDNNNKNKSNKGKINIDSFRNISHSSSE